MRNYRNVVFKQYICMRWDFGALCASQGIMSIMYLKWCIMGYTKNRITRVSEEWDTWREENKSRLRRVKSGSKLLNNRIKLVIRFWKGLRNRTARHFFLFFLWILEITLIRNIFGIKHKYWKTKLYFEYERSL